VGYEGQVTVTFVVRGRVLFLVHDLCNDFVSGGEFTRLRLRYEVLTAVIKKLAVFWDVTPCSLVYIYIPTFHSNICFWFFFVLKTHLKTYGRFKWKEVLINGRYITLARHISRFQYSETNAMHFLFSLSRIKGLYMFRALIAHPQEALYKRHLINCVRVMSVGCTRTGQLFSWLVI
jgi:hypothetical protein